MGSFEVGVFQMGSAQRCFSQVDAAQVQRIVGSLMTPVASSQNCGCRLDVGAKIGNLASRRRRPCRAPNARGTLRPPARALAQEGRQHLEDGFVVGLRVVSDALEREDAAKPNVEFVVVRELLDGAREALRDLSLSVERERSPREIGAHPQHEAAESLEEMASEVTLRLRPVCAGHVAPARLDERQLRKKDHDRKEGCRYPDSG